MAINEKSNPTLLERDVDPNLPPIVSPDDWAAAWGNLLVKEKAMTRARDALAAECRGWPSSSLTNLPGRKVKPAFSICSKAGGN